MNFDEIRQLLDIVRAHDLAEFELERDGFKIRVRKDRAPQRAVFAAPPVVIADAPAAPPPDNARTVGAVADPSSESASGGAEDGAEVELAVMKSPIVGTFYRSSEPVAKPFVEVGDVVQKGQVLCIIEAMKLMNEIESEYAGEIVAIYAENGQPVQYGERLFAFRVK